MSVDGRYDDRPAEGQLDWPRRSLSVEEPVRIIEDVSEPGQGPEARPEAREGSGRVGGQTSSDRHEPPVNTDAEQDPENIGWSGKGLELSPHANRVAEAGLEQRRIAEGRDGDGNYTDRGITPTMRRIEADLEHGSLVPDTEKFALKSPDRFKEKLAKMITLEPDVPEAELADSVHDGIRYTFLFQHDHYTDGVQRACGVMGGAGFELIAFKPCWDRAEYKGANSQWRDYESGVLFEVQFHTAASWEAKQATHDAYEKIESPLTSPHERDRLRAYQRSVCESVAVPPGALELKPYPEERWRECQLLSRITLFWGADVRQTIRPDWPGGAIQMTAPSTSP